MGHRWLHTMYLTDEELEVAESWITELQDLFAEATALKIQYIQNSVRSEIVAWENTLHHGSQMKERAERERKAEKALIMRTKGQTVFGTICNNTEHFLDNNNASHTLERSLKQIEGAYAECKSANDDVLDLADRDTAENAIKFAAQIQCRLDDMTACKAHVANRSERWQSREERDLHVLQPSAGKIKIAAIWRRNSRSSTIQTRLYQWNVEKARWEVWRSSAKVADVIIDGIRRTRIIREGEEKRFVELVEIVEDGYRDKKGSV